MFVSFDFAGNQRGKFGDGLPSSTLVLVRENASQLEIESVGRQYKFSLKQNDVIGDPCLNLDYSECANDKANTVLMWNGPYCSSEPAKESRKPSQLFDPTKDTKVTITGFSEVIS